MKNIASPLFDISGRCTRIVAAACLLGAMLVGCTSPAAKDSRVAAPGSSTAEPSAAASPRFAQGGPEAEEYGASSGYPVGDRETCPRPAFLVGCHSHFDQVYEGRLVRRTTTPSPLRERPRSRQFATSIKAKL